MALSLDNLPAIIAEALDIPCEGVTESASMDLTEKWDSAASMTIILQVEEAYGVTFEAEEIVECTSLVKIRNILKQHGVVSA